MSKRGLAVCLAVGMLVSACSQSTATTPGPSPAVSASAATSPSPATTPTPQSPTPKPTASPAPTCAGRTFSAMSEEERIGQLFLMGLENDVLGPAELDAIRSRHVGSVWFTTRTTIGVAGVRRVADAIQAEATQPATARVEFFVAANQEGGLIQALNGRGFSRIPSAVDQGKLTPVLLDANATNWGRELAAAGVNLNFAPVFDVVPPGGDATNQPIGVLHREYGHDAQAAGSHAAAFARGMARAGIATTAKHFPGLGRVAGNTDETANVVDDATRARDPYLASFRAGIDAGVPFVMVALATYTRIDPDHLAAFSPTVMGDLLRADLGFTGAVMSDDLGATEAVKDIPAGKRAVDFLVAGGDFIVSKTADATTAMADAVAARVATDAAFGSRVDDAALRILEAKDGAGLLPCS